MPSGDQINPLEAAYAGLYAANEASAYGLHLGSLPAFYALARLNAQGVAPSQNKLITHWILWRQVAHRTQGYEMIRRLVRHGFAELQNEQRLSRVMITLAGKTYLRTFEKALKKRPKV